MKPLEYEYELERVVETHNLILLSGRSFGNGVSSENWVGTFFFVSAVHLGLEMTESGGKEGLSKVSTVDVAMFIYVSVNLKTLHVSALVFFGFHVKNLLIINPILTQTSHSQSNIRPRGEKLKSGPKSAVIWDFHKVKCSWHGRSQAADETYDKIITVDFSSVEFKFLPNCLFCRDIIGWPQRVFSLLHSWCGSKLPAALRSFTRNQRAKNQNSFNWALSTQAWYPAFSPCLDTRCLIVCRIRLFQLAWAHCIEDR